MASHGARNSPLETAPLGHDHPAPFEELGLVGIGGAHVVAFLLALLFDSVSDQSPNSTSVSLTVFSDISSHGDILRKHRAEFAFDRAAEDWLSPMRACARRHSSSESNATFRAYTAKHICSCQWLATALNSPTHRHSCRSLFLYFPGE